MNRPLTERTLTSDWEAPGAALAAETLQVGASLGSFIIDEVLGHGGMGVVYQATHRQTGAEVALKTLHRVDSRGVEKLKAEFRQLSQVQHSHLVQLFELHTVGEHCFLTMERIHGMTLGDCFRSETPVVDETVVNQLKRAFAQISEGLIALHEQGLLHLDLKPDNVMIDTAGRVRILDFGLVKPLAQAGAAGQRLAGTPRYIAPERTRSRTESTATDWYALGVMLAELLVPSWAGPGTPIKFSDDIPPDLAELCHRLMSESPSNRPSGQEVIQVLGVAVSGTYAVHRPFTSNLKRSRPNLVGREHELATLERSLDNARNGTPGWLHLVGESGVGKTSMLSCFRDGAAAQPDVLVLEGSCHERESTPFQGLDSILEGLAHALTKSAAGRLTKSQKVWLKSAESLSPALSDLCKPVPLVESRGGDPVERRREAFIAVKALLVGLSSTKAVTVIVDDVQWGDTDGARLLAELLADPTPSRVLILTTSREGGSAIPPFIFEIEKVLAVRGTHVKKEELVIARLSDEDVRNCLPSRGADVPSGIREAIVRVARGLPFLANALGSHPWGKDEEPSLAALVELRLRGAPPGAIDVMRAVALSPSPLPQPVALEFARKAAQRGEVLSSLRHAGLVRTVGESPDGPLEPYHALVAGMVQEQLPEEERREIRLRLARSLESKALASAEHLANLYHLAQATCEAARWAPQAAREAEAALAFESAAHWYGRAATWTPDQASNLLPQKARCLEYAGRGAAAAETYERAAEIAQAAQVELVRAAGSAWLSAGYVDKGLAVLNPELYALGTPVPKSEKTALFTSFRLLWRLWRRGTEFRAQGEQQCNARKLARVDATWNAAKGLGVVMPMRGLALQLHCLLAALDAGESARIARSLAVLGPMLMGSPLEAMGLRWMAQARDLASQIGDDYLSGILFTFDAVAMCARWEPPNEIIKLAEEGLRKLKSRAGAIAWEQNMALTIGLRAREQLGRFNELETLGTSWLAESIDRGDLFAQVMARQACAMSCLASGRASDARKYARASVETWSLSIYTVQHYYGLRYELQCDLLGGDVLGARDRLRNSWAVIKSAQLLRNPISRPEILFLRGLIELAAATNLDQTSCRTAERIARVLERTSNPVSQAHALLLKAATAWLRRPSPQVLSWVDQARDMYQRRGLVVQALCVEKAVADARGDAALGRQVDERLRALGVQDPGGYAYLHSPRFASRGTPRRALLQSN